MLFKSVNIRYTVPVFVGMALSILTATSLGYLLVEPYISLAKIRTTVTNNDLPAFSNYLNHYKIQDALKAQFSSELSRRMVGDLSSTQLNSNKLVTVAVEKMVDEFINPTNVLAALRQQMQIAKSVSENKSIVEKMDPSIDWSFKRSSFNKISAVGIIINSNPETKINLEFERAQFGVWKLIGMPIAPTELSKI